MPIWARNASSWQLVKTPYVYTPSGWVRPTRVYVHNGSSWVLVYATLTYGGNVNDVNLNSWLGGPGTRVFVWVQINGVYLWAGNTSSYGLFTDGLIGGSYVWLQNQGAIVGAGGNGGPGGGGGGSNGQPGGVALRMTIPFFINNLGGIYGGGGGGAGAATWPGHAPQCGGGGGGQGFVGGVGGPGYAGGLPGTNGSLGGPGIWQPQYHCSGGDGGAWGQAGVSSGNCDAQPGATGGAPGTAIQTNGQSLTWINVGDVRGPIT